MSTLKTNNIQHVDRSDPSIIINTDGSVNIAGTMTYEDVTNVDAVGIITGRSNIDAQKQVHVGTGVSVKAGGLNVTAGITTVQALQATTGNFSSNVDVAGEFTVAETIAHTGDTNNKISFPAADTITLTTAGTERFQVDSSGNIYVGGVGGSATAGSLFFNDTSANASKIAQVNGSSALTFHTGSSQPERLRITSGGDMGLGTNSPASAHDRVLTIAGTNSAELKLTGSNYGVTDTDGGDILFSYGGLYMINNESSGNLHFLTGSGPTERLRIQNDGKIGVNTTAAYSIFTAYGENRTDTGSATGQITAKDNAAYNANPTAGIIFQGLYHSNGATAVFGGVTGFKENATEGNYAGALAFHSRTNGAVAAERMRINGTGNVSIGGLDPVPTASYYNTASLHIHQTTNSTNAGAQIHLTTANKGSAAGDGSQVSQYNGSLYINNQDDGNTYFYNNGSATATITAAGNFGVNTQSPTDKLHVNGTALISSNLYCNNNVYLAANKGIYFDGGTGASNYMDDYEVGSWTPANSTVGLYDDSTKFGAYQKIGDYVHFSFGVRVVSNSSSINMYIDGFPFTVVSTSGQYQYGGSFTYMTGGSGHSAFSFLLEDGGSRIWIYSNAGTQIDSTYFDNHYLRGHGFAKVQ